MRIYSEICKECGPAVRKVFAVWPPTRPPILGATYGRVSGLFFSTPNLTLFDVPKNVSLACWALFLSFSAYY